MTNNHRSSNDNTNYNNDTSINTTCNDTNDNHNGRSIHTYNVNTNNTDDNRSNNNDCIVDFGWHVPMDFQRHFPTPFHLSEVYSKGLSLVQWIVNGFLQWIVSGIFPWIFTFVISGV